MSCNCIEVASYWEQALGSFKWAKQLDEDWKKKGIKDETIELIDERGEDDVRRAVEELMVSCYNNLAACYLGRATQDPEPGNTADGDYRLCVSACSEALELQPDCAKVSWRTVHGARMAYCDGAVVALCDDNL